jgi:hypothetical protein
VLDAVAALVLRHPALVKAQADRNVSGGTNESDAECAKPSASRVVSWRTPFPSIADAQSWRNCRLRD